jgi:hypothetical protein
MTLNLLAQMSHSVLVVCITSERARTYTDNKVFKKHSVEAMVDPASDCDPVQALAKAVAVFSIVLTERDEAHAQIKLLQAELEETKKKLEEANKKINVPGAQLTPSTEARGRKQRPKLEFEPCRKNGLPPELQLVPPPPELQAKQEDKTPELQAKQQPPPTPLSKSPPTPLCKSSPPPPPPPPPPTPRPMPPQTPAAGAKRQRSQSPPEAAIGTPSAADLKAGLAKLRPVQPGTEQPQTSSILDPTQMLGVTPRLQAIANATMGQPNEDQQWSDDDHSGRV